jgi:acyl-CoA reductase-like NAD-dependent aldehyde dehydrogenase
MADRIDVRKTYKLFVGGAFPRSESGRSYEVESHDGRFLANAARASRKDARDAVAAARKAFPGWWGRTPYNRGQVLYRVAELLEGRAAQFVSEVADAEGLDESAARREVEAAIDRWVWYAGWADKVDQLLGTVNPVGKPTSYRFEYSLDGGISAFEPQWQDFHAVVHGFDAAPLAMRGPSVPYLSVLLSHLLFGHVPPLTA